MRYADDYYYKLTRKIEDVTLFEQQIIDLKFAKNSNNKFTTVSFSPDSKMFASGTTQGQVKFWKLDNYSEITTVTGHLERVNSVNFSPDGKKLASGSSDKLIKIWNTRTFKEIACLKGHISPVLSVCFRADGKTLASAGISKTLILWNLDAKKENRSSKHTYLFWIMEEWG